MDYVIWTSLARPGSLRTLASPGAERGLVSIYITGDGAEAKASQRGLNPHPLKDGTDTRLRLEFQENSGDKYTLKELVNALG